MLLRSKFGALVVVFVIVTALVFALKNQLSQWNIDYRVMLGANILLFILGLISISLHSKAVNNTNPHVFVRSVMLSNIIKLFTLAAAVLVYISAAGKSASTSGVFAALFLYIIYTWVEKRAAIQLSKTKKQ